MSERICPVCAGAGSIGTKCAYTELSWEEKFRIGHNAALCCPSCRDGVPHEETCHRCGGEGFFEDLSHKE